MMIAIDRLETLMIDESKHPIHVGGEVDPFRHCYPMLYLAAKFGEITLLDMLIASHENDFSTLYCCVTSQGVPTCALCVRSLNTSKTGSR